MHLPLPNIAMGVFSLKNIAFNAALDLPFTGDKPTLLRLAFCERENPFRLTICCLGGGGFVGLTLGLDGIHTLEAGIEFGGELSLDVGVASGGVSIMAGIYFKYDFDSVKGGGTYLEGYVKIHGELSVLLIASISMTFYMSLTYQSAGNKCWGQATLTVEVSILFISFSVDVHVERQFSGDDHDPPFSAAVTPAQWQLYADAFAA